jgi:hypothetical protein
VTKHLELALMVEAGLAPALELAVRRFVAFHASRRRNYGGGRQPNVIQRVILQ